MVHLRVIQNSTLFQGFSLPAGNREAMLMPRISGLQCTASLFIVMASQSSIIPDSYRSGRQAADAIPSAPSSSPVGSGVRLHLISWGPDYCSWLSPGRHLSGLGLPSPRLRVRRLGRAVGCSPPDRNLFRPLALEEAQGSINAREPLAVECGLQHFHLSVASSAGAIFLDNLTALAYLRKWGGGGGDLVLRFAERRRST